MMLSWCGTSPMKNRTPRGAPRTTSHPVSGSAARYVPYPARDLTAENADTSSAFSAVRELTVT